MNVNSTEKDYGVNFVTLAEINKILNNSDKQMVGSNASGLARVNSSVSPNSNPAVITRDIESPAGLTTDRNVQRKFEYNPETDKLTYQKQYLQEIEDTYKELYSTRSDEYGRSSIAMQTALGVGGIVEGASQTALNTIMDVGQTFSTGLNRSLEEERWSDYISSFSDEDKDKKEALDAVSQYPDENMLKYADVNLMTANGNPLSDKAKEIVSKYQNLLLARKEDDDWTKARQIFGEKWALGETPFLKFTDPSRYNKGNRNSSIIGAGQMVGNVLASYYMFRAAGVGAAAPFTKAAMLSSKFGMKMAPALLAMSSVAGYSAVFGSSFVPAFNSARVRALLSGKNDSEANNIAFFNGLGSGLLEFGAFKIGRRLLTREPSFRNVLLRDILPEGFQEGSQTALEDSIYKATGIDDKSFLEISSDVVLAAAAGFVGGGLVPMLDKRIARANRSEHLRDYLIYSEEEGIRRINQNYKERLAKIQEQKLAEENLKKEQQLAESQRIEEIKKLQQQTLSDYKELYVEKAKKVNPDISNEQLEKGWSAIEAFLSKKDNLSNIVQRLDNLTSNIIETINISDTLVKDVQQKFMDKLKPEGVSEQTIKDLFSGDAIRETEAAYTLLENEIVSEFEANGSKQQGKLYAKMLRGLTYSSALLSGNPKEYLSQVYEAFKPTILSLTRARINGQSTKGLESVLDDIKKAKESDFAGGLYGIAMSAREIYRLINESKPENNGQISILLFGDSSKSGDIDSVISALNTQATIEEMIFDEMGLSYGNDLTHEDMFIAAVLRQQGLSQEQINKALSIKQRRNPNESYEKAKERLFPKLSKKELAVLRRLENSSEGLYNSETNTIAVGEDLSQGQLLHEGVHSIISTANKEKESNEMIPEETAESQAEEEYNKKRKEYSDKIKELNKRIESLDNKADKTEADIEALQNDMERLESIEEEYDAFRDEKLKERSILLNQSISALNQSQVGLLPAIGAMNRFLDRVYEIIDSQGRDVTDTEVQETVAEAVVAFTKEGKTQDEELTRLLNEASVELNRQLEHPNKSLYENLSPEQKNLLNEQIRNIFEKNSTQSILEDLNNIDNALYSKKPELLLSEMRNFLEKYAIPDGDFMLSAIDKLQDNPNASSAFAIYNMLNLNARTLATNIAVSDEYEAEIANDGEVSYFEYLPKRKRLETPKNGTYMYAVAVQRYLPEKDSMDDIRQFLKETKNAFSAQKIKDSFAELILPTSRFLKDVHPALQSAVRRKFFEMNKQNYEDMLLVRVIPELISEHNELNKNNKDKQISKTDLIELERAYFSDADERQAVRDWLNDKFKGSQRQDLALRTWDALCQRIDNIAKLHKEYGVDITDGNASYLPRLVKDIDGLSRYLGYAEKNSSLNKKIRELSRKEGISADKIIDELNALFQRNSDQFDVSQYKQRSFTKSILRDDPSLLDFYADPFDTIAKYFQTSNMTIMMRSLIGKRSKDGTAEEVHNDNQNQLERGIIGKFVYEASTTDKYGNVSQEALNRMQNALRGLTQRTASNSDMANFIRQLNAITTLGNPVNALNQSIELGLTAYRFGSKNTLSALMEDIKKEGTFTIDALGLESLNEVYKTDLENSLSKAQRWVYEKSGFSKMDILMKNTTLGAGIKFYSDVLSNPSHSKYKESMEYFNNNFPDQLYSSEQKNQILSDIKNQNLTDDVMFFMTNVLSETQPINSLELPPAYNKLGSWGKAGYQFMSVSLKQLDFLIDDIWVNSFLKKKPIEGMKKLLKLMFFASLVGVPKEILSSLLRGQKPNITGTVVWSLPQFFLINEYTISSMKRDGFFSGLANMASPNSGLIDNISRDFISVVSGNEFRGHTAKSVPLIGRLGYDLFLGGADYARQNGKSLFSDEGFDMFDYEAVENSIDFITGGFYK